VAALVFGFFLYWAMQPIVMWNQAAPHLSLGRTVPPILGRRDMADTLQTDRTSIEAAQQENRLLDLGTSPVIGGGQPGSEAKPINAKGAPQQKVRRRPAKHRVSPQPAPSWATRNPHDAGFWFR
jgi:hypothetical protein